MWTGLSQNDMSLRDSPTIAMRRSEGTPPYGYARLSQGIFPF